MAGNIKGIKIELEADVTKLDKSLRDVNKETRKTDTELRQINKALKFNPKSVDLWKQKQQVLTNKISETDKKLNLLKQKQAAMDADGVEKNSAEYRQLQREIITTSSQLDHFQKEADEAGDELKRMDIEEAEAKMKSLEEQVKKTGGAFSKENFDKAAEKFKAGGEKLTAAGEALAPVSAASAAMVAGLGAASYKAGQYADDLNTLSKVTGIGTGELQKYSLAANLVDVSTEDIAKSQQRLKKQIYDAANGSKSAGAAFRALGVDVKDSNGNLRDSDEVFQEVIQKLGGMDNETERAALAQKLMGKSAANLNPLIADQGETYKNVTEMLKKYDLDYIDQDTLNKANEFNDQLDKMKLLGTVAFSSVGSELAAYLLPALEKLVDVAGKIAGWISELDPQILAIVGVIAAVVAALAPVLLFLGKMAFAISSIISLVGTIGPAIGGAMAVITGPVGIVLAIIAALIVVGVLLYKNWDTIKEKAGQLKDFIVTAWTNLKNMVIAIFTAIKNFVTKALKAVLIAVFPVIAAGILLWKNWDKIKAKAAALLRAISNAFNRIKTAISNAITAAKNRAISVFNTMKNRAVSIVKSLVSSAGSAMSAIKEKLTSPITKARETISGALQKIRNLFPLNIGRVFTGLKLPHISVSGGKAPFGIGGKGSLPHFSVDWYAKAIGRGMILDHPTIFGYQNGKFLGAGEAGPEMVAGAGTVSGLIAQAVAAGMRNAAGEMATALTSSMALAAGGPQQIVIPVYLYKNGPEMGRQIVNTYDTWKGRLGR